MQPIFSYLQIADRASSTYEPRMDLQLRIREIRLAKGLTLAQVAEKVGISVPHLSQVERGIKNVNNHLLIRIAKALDCQPRDLIEGEQDKDAVELALILDGLVDEDRARVRAFAEALAASRIADAQG